VKQRFWQLVMEEGVSAYEAAKLEDIPFQTAYTWKINWNKLRIDKLNNISKLSKKCRKLLLTDEHKEFLKKLMRMLK
jgi:transposase